MARDRFFTLPGSTRNSLPEETNCGEVLNSGMVVAAPAKVASMLPRHPRGQMGVMPPPLDTLDQSRAVRMRPRFCALKRPKGLGAAPHGHPASVDVATQA